jgi:hypothetical protein
MRKPRFVHCKRCDKLIGINTENGIMIGDVIVEELDGACECGEKFYIKRMYKESEININEQLSCR